MARAHHIDLHTYIRTYIHTLAGGGCVETALSIHLEGVATSMASRDQLAVAQFAEALLIIPRTLTVNAGE